jgi:hypothetical protein
MFQPNNSIATSCDSRVMFVGVVALVAKKATHCVLEHNQAQLQSVWADLAQ